MAGLLDIPPVVSVIFVMKSITISTFYLQEGRIILGTGAEKICHVIIIYKKIELYFILLE